MCLFFISTMSLFNPFFHSWPYYLLKFPLCFPNFVIHLTHILLSSPPKPLSTVSPTAKPLHPPSSQWTPSASCQVTSTSVLFHTLSKIFVPMHISSCIRSPTSHPNQASSPSYRQPVSPVMPICSYPGFPGILPCGFAYFLSLCTLVTFGLKHELILLLSFLK